MAIWLKEAVRDVIDEVALFSAGRLAREGPGQVYGHVNTRRRERVLNESWRINLYKLRMTLTTAAPRCPQEKHMPSRSLHGNKHTHIFHYRTTPRDRFYSRKTNLIQIPSLVLHSSTWPLLMESITGTASRSPRKRWICVKVWRRCAACCVFISLRWHYILYVISITVFSTHTTALSRAFIYINMHN